MLACLWRRKTQNSVRGFDLYPNNVLIANVVIF